MSVILSGLSFDIPAVTLNRLCASGQEAVHYASLMIESSRAKLILAGGVESMTRAPYIIMKPEKGFDRKNHSLVDSTIGWRFTNPKMSERFEVLSLGESAELTAEKFGITRFEQDEFSKESHLLASKAKEKFKEEIVAVKNEFSEIILDYDEHIRDDISLEKLAKLRPIFKEGGTVTAGNSSGINDGACILIIMEKEFAIANGYHPLAEIITTTSIGIHPNDLGIGPVPATKKALTSIGMNEKNISLWEISEAFASMTLSSIKLLNLDRENVNVNGGGISIGHPLGASGARMLLNLAKELKNNDKEFGISTMCIGVGQGTATLIKNLN